MPPFYRSYPCAIAHPVPPCHRMRAASARLPALRAGPAAGSRPCLPGLYEAPHRSPDPDTNRYPNRNPNRACQVYRRIYDDEYDTRAFAPPLAAPSHPPLPLPTHAHPASTMTSTTHTPTRLLALRTALLMATPSHIPPSTHTDAHPAGTTPTSTGTLARSAPSGPSRGSSSRRCVSSPCEHLPCPVFPLYHASIWPLHCPRSPRLPQEPPLHVPDDGSGTSMATATTIGDTNSVGASSGATYKAKIDPRRNRDRIAPLLAQIGIKM